VVLVVVVVVVVVVDVVVVAAVVVMVVVVAALRYLTPPLRYLRSWRKLKPPPATLRSTRCC